MRNIRKISGHLQIKSQIADWASPYRLQVLSPVETHHDQPGIWFEGQYWRVFPFFHDALCVDKAENHQIAFAAGSAFGHFCSHLSDFDASNLEVTIPGFHSGYLRIQQFRQACLENPVDRLDDIKPFVGLIHENLFILEQFDELRQTMPTRVIHHDAKLSNVLLNRFSLEPVAVIDLDTVMAGSVLSDFGDLVRSLTSSLPEDAEIETPERSTMKIKMDYFKALAEGFVAQSAGMLVQAEKKHLVFGALAITLMVALRFLTDYLNGDIYFETAYPQHNLTRAKNQFALFQALKSKQNEMDQFISALVLQSPGK